MKVRTSSLLSLALLLAPTPGLAHRVAPAVASATREAKTPPAPPMFERIAPPRAPGVAIPLYEDAVRSPQAEGEVWDRMLGVNQVVRNVTRPTVTPFLPPAGKATGAAVVILPGGGFNVLAMEGEGWAIARWFAARGVAAFVVKYRLKPTPADEKALLGDLTGSMGALLTDPEKAMAPYAPPAVADAIQALKLVRAGAGKWGIDPSRVGLIGFSAGAQATRDVVLSVDPAVRPAFFGYVYGPMRTVTVPADAPPMFAALALDDPLFGKQGFGIVEAWHRANRPVEMHAYEQGSHGFGAGKPGTTSTMVLPELYAWMKSRGLLAPASPPTRR